MALGGFLGEDALAVDLDFKDAAGRLDQAHFGVGKGIPDLGRQTGGPRFVVSDDAVFDRDGHGGKVVALDTPRHGADFAPQLL